jgi:hypothetical protein
MLCRGKMQAQQKSFLRVKCPTAIQGLLEMSPVIQVAFIQRESRFFVKVQ